jgi:hypothetical protein
MKILVALVSLSLGGGCSVKSSSPQAQTANSPTQQTMKPVPYQFPQLTKPESQNLDRELPKDARRILEQSEELELLSIRPCSWALNPEFSRTALTKITPDIFQGCPIEKSVKVKDAALKKQLLDGLYLGIGKSGSSAACFKPRHGIRGVHNGEKVELVICFECHNYRGASKSGAFVGGFSDAPQEFFNSLLSEDAGN